MKPDYKNWIPKGMLFSLIAGTMLSLALLLVFGVFGIGVGGKLRIVLGAVFGIAPLFVAAAAFVGSGLLRRDSFGCRGGAVETGCFGMLDRFVHGRDSFHYPLGVFIAYDSIVAQFVLSCK